MTETETIREVKPPSYEVAQRDKAAWAKAKGLKISNSSKTGLFFLGKPLPDVLAKYTFRGKFTSGIRARNVRVFDHTDYWIKNGKPYCITTQPYHPSMDDLADLTELCRDFNLEFYVSGFPAWHYPGMVSFIMITKKENKNDRR